MHIHILGIAGTFMGSLALIAKELGHTVTGQDQDVYPPMSLQLDKQGIKYTKGYVVEDMPEADTYLIGNALSRGNACVEHILEEQLPYTSGAQWLGENVLYDKWVLAVSGTHGKTTTASILAWILEKSGLNPNFLIGGVAQNFGVSARITNSRFFVIEADEYDTAFFDKRSKFVHYRPTTLIINNLEFDHADIFDSLKDIQKQFHHLIRTIARDGLIIYPDNDKNINDVLSMGVYCQTQTTPKCKLTEQGFEFKPIHKVVWDLMGAHNMQNGLHAIFAAHHIGVPITVACDALSSFKGVKRRLEIKYQNPNITVYDDFAHHPTAISSTISGLRAKVGDAHIVAVVELRSNTMRMGHHQQTLLESFCEANQVYMLKPKTLLWDIDTLVKKSNITLANSIDEIVNSIASFKKGHLVIMSNGGFGDIQNKIITQLKNQHSKT